jgi:hypothetical protein
MNLNVSISKSDTYPSLKHGKICTKDDLQLTKDSPQLRLNFKKERKGKGNKEKEKI